MHLSLFSSFINPQNLDGKVNIFSTKLTEFGWAKRKYLLQ